MRPFRWPAADCGVSTKLLVPFDGYLPVSSHQWLDSLGPRPTFDAQANLPPLPSATSLGICFDRKRFANFSAVFSLIFSIGATSTRARRRSLRRWRRQRRPRCRQSTSPRVLLPAAYVKATAAATLVRFAAAAVVCGPAAVMSHLSSAAQTTVLLMILLLYLADVPRVLAMPSRVYLARGLTGRVECPVDANPPATLILWSRNGRTIDVTDTTLTGSRSVSQLNVLPMLYEWSM